MLVDPILSSIRSSPESLPRTHVLKAFLSTKLCVLNNTYYFDAITSVAMLSWPNSSKHLVFRGSYVAFLQGFVFFFFKYLFILFLAGLGLGCCAGFSPAAVGGYSSLQCSGFLLLWLLLLWSIGSRRAGSVVWAPGL